ncbi:MAG: LAGLIDADG family homing endonuclease [Spirochaetota bacterium]
MTKYHKFFLAGFIEGEGSMCVSIKKHPSSKYGYLIDPEFFIYQHIRGRKILEMAQTIFMTGRIYPKPGNEKVLVFAIDNRRSIVEKVIPFLQKYLIITAKKEAFEVFKKVVYALERKEHTTKEGLVNIVKLAYSLKGKGKERKRLIDQVIDDILRD